MQALASVAPRVPLVQKPYEHAVHAVSPVIFLYVSAAHGEHVPEERSNVVPISQTHNPLMRLLPLLKASARLKASGKDMTSAVMNYQARY